MLALSLSQTGTKEAVMGRSRSQLVLEGMKALLRSRKLRPWVILAISAALIAGLTAVAISPPGEQTSGSRHQVTGSASAALANARISLGKVTEHDLDSTRTDPSQFRVTRQLSADYGSNGAQFLGSNFGFDVGLGAVGRGAQMQDVVAPRKDRTDGAAYGHNGVSETFAASEQGIEQSFTLTRRISGSGPVTIEIPISGLQAQTPRESCPRDGASLAPEKFLVPSPRGPVEKSLNTKTKCPVVNQTVDLVDPHGDILATYSGLRVVDAKGKHIAASMRPEAGGSEIAISVEDTGATYPLHVDPIWSQVTSFTDGGDGEDLYGWSVAISGSTGIVGEPGGYDEPGHAYVYTDAGGVWSQTQELTPSVSSNNDAFGYAVAVSGTTAVIGAFGSGGEYGEAGPGAAFVFTLTGGTWSQTAELLPSDGEDGYEFGASVAISGSNVAVGSPYHTVSGNADQGVVYVFSGSGASWTQTAELTTSGSLYEPSFGYTVALSGSTLVGGTNPPGSYWASEPNAVVFSLSSGTWSQTGTLQGTGPRAIGENFGYPVAVSGSNILLGGDGYAYMFTLSDGSWVQSEQLSDGTSDREFGFAVALQGDTALISDINTDPDGSEGTVYEFDYTPQTPSSPWTQTSDFYPSGDTTEEFGWSLGLSNNSALVGTYYDGYAYVFSALSVDPLGSPVLADAYGGGSQSEPCQCTGTDSANPTSLDPVDLATGDFTESHTDLSLPGAGVPLAFTRTYDAQAAQAEVTNGSADPPLGYGWSDSLGLNVSYDSSTQTATVTEENGAQTTFNEYESGSANPWCSGSTNFCASAPRIEATLNQNTGGSWTYVRTTGSSAQETFTFSSGGALTSIADATGDTVSSSSYSPGTGQTVCPSGDTCQAWTSSASGRQLVLATDSSGQLVSVFDPNAGQSASFSYSGSGCSSWSGSETPDLCSVTDPGGVTSTFTYDSANSAADFDYDMLTETPPGSSGTTTNVYNTGGQISQQTDPSGAVTTLAYSGTSASFDGGTTTVTSYPDGTGSGEPQDSTIYSFSSNVLVAETQGATGTSPTTETYQRDPVSLLSDSVADGNGNFTQSAYQLYDGTGGTEISSANVLSSTDAMDNTTQNVYNAFNEAWCTVDPAETADGVTCPSSPPTSPPAPGASDPDLGATINFYNSSDQLTATTDTLGNTTTYSYTSGVSGVPNGLMYCSVDPVDYQASVTCPSYGATHVSGTTTSTFDSAGDTLTSTNADGDTTTKVYGVSGHPGLVSSSTDPDGTVTSYTYNGAGQVLTQTVSFNSYSATTAYAYDSYGRQYCEVDPNEYALGVRCPSSPPSASSPPADVTSTFYDADGRVIQTTSPIGGTTVTAYDDAGNVYCTVTPANYASGTRCPSSEPTTPPTVGSDSYLGATITTYDANGRATQVTNPLGGITLSSYDDDNNVLQTTVESNNSTSDPNVVTTNTYDADDQVTSTTVDSGSSLASTTQKSYDPNGNAYCSVSANATAAGSSTYQCPPWQAAWIASPPSPSSLYSSTPTSAQADNVTTTFYNDDGQQVQSTNPDVETTVNAIDGDGRTYCSVDPVNYADAVSCPAEGATHVTGTSTTSYDAAGQTLATTDQLGDLTSYTYDAAGHVLTTTDPRGEVTTNCYYDEDATGQCAHSAPATGGSGDDLYTSTTPATTADPSGETTTSTYFPGGQADTTATPGATATAAYDAAGDLVSTTYSGIASGYATPTNTSDTYNVDGSVHTMTDATGTTTYGYDDLGDVTSQALVAAGGSGLANATTSYTYYTTGVLASLTYPAYSGHSDPVVDYTYDGTGAMDSSTDWLGNEVTYSHDADGNPTNQANDVSTSNPGGTSSTAQTYDAADNATSAVSSIKQTCGSSETLTQSFSGSTGSRNPDGQLTSSTNSYSATCSGQSTSTADYSYDAAGRVTYQGTTAQGSSPATFAYDASGDPTTLTSHASAGGSTDSYTQAFDNAGEVTSQTPVSGSGGSTSTYSYDTLGAQVSAAAGSTSDSYGYNGAGQMVSATTPAGATTYLYNGDGLESAATAEVGGTTWNAPADIDSTLAIDATTCVSSSFCVAVGASGYATVYNGTSWSTPVDADSARTLDAVSCASSSFCVAVDTSGYEVTWTGSSWGSPSDIDSSRSLNKVACPSSTLCFAVGSSGYFVKYTGSWASPVDGDSNRNIDAISCSSTSFCAAADTVGYVLTYNGSVWGGNSDVDSSRDIDALSCVSSSLCVAADTSGYALTYNGTSWASATDVDSTRAIKALACPSSTTCVAVDSSGYALTYNGTSWSSATDVDGSAALDALSCASSTFCVAADTSGNELTYNGSGWSSAQDIDATRSISSVSCPSTTFCAAVDGSGYGVLFAASESMVTTTEQLTWDTNPTLALVLSDGVYDYIYGSSDTPVEEINIATSTPTYMAYNSSGSTWVTTNETGDMTGFWGYDAFGAPAFGTPTSTFGYGGQYTDATTGFGVNRARDYNSATGTFTTRDPAFGSTDTAYTYAGDDPVNASDPTGDHVCNGDPLTWLGCLGNFATNAVDTAIGILVRPLVVQARSDLAADQTTTSGGGIGGCDFQLTSSTSLSSSSELSQRGGAWETHPDWIGIDISGTFLSELAEVFPPLAVTSIGGQLLVDRYGDVYAGPQAGVSVPGLLALADAGWIWSSTIPSRSYLSRFISGLSVSGQVAYADGLAVAGSVVYGNVGHGGLSAFGIQVGIGYGEAHTGSLQASWLFSLGNIGVSW